MRYQRRGIKARTQWRVVVPMIICLMTVLAGSCSRKPSRPPEEKPTPLALLKQRMASIEVPEASSLDPLAREQFEIDLHRATHLPDPRKAPEYAFVMGRLLHGLGYPEMALTWYGAALEMLTDTTFDRFEKDRFLCWYYSSLAAEQVGRHAEALRFINAALNVVSDDLAVLLRRAELLRTLNAAAGVGTDDAVSDAEVRKAYERVLGKAPLAPAHYGLGRLEALRGRFSEAETHYRKALELAPKYVAAREALVELLRTRDRGVEADELLRTAPPGDDSGFTDPYVRELTRRTSMAGLELNRWRRMAESGRAEEAEAAIRFRLLNRETDPDAWNLLGSIILIHRLPKAEPRYRRLMLSEAKRCFLTAYQQDPDFNESRYNYGMALLVEGQRDAALEQFRAVVAMDDAYWMAHFQIAQILFRDPVPARRNLPEAEKHYRAVLKTMPDNMHACGDLAALLEEQTRFEEAHALLREAVLKAPDDTGTANQLARFLLTCPSPKFRNPTDALAIAERVNELTPLTSPDAPEYLETLAIAQVEIAQLGGKRDINQLVKAFDTFRIAIEAASTHKRDDLLPRLRSGRAQVESWLREAGRLPG